MSSYVKLYEIKPCPYCDSEDVFCEMTFPFGAFYILCNQCNAETELFDYRVLAVNHWNSLPRKHYDKSRDG